MIQYLFSKLRAANFYFTINPIIVYCKRVCTPMHRVTKCGLHLMVTVTVFGLTVIVANLLVTVQLNTDEGNIRVEH